MQIVDSKIHLNTHTPSLTVRRWWTWCDSYFVCLCGFYNKAFPVESYLAPCSHIFSVMFSIVITPLGEDRTGLYASRAFV